jgi:alpha-amylase
MVNFAFGIHNHQPLDNFDSVIEDAFQTAYQPFLNVLREFDKVRVNLHISGPLLEWLQAHHPAYIDDLKDLVGTHRAEILTSGLYEPVLTLLPEEDRLGQINAYSERLHRLFGMRPRGLWLTERVWEQSLVATLVKASVEYVVVDDTHFRNVGLPDDQLFGYYLTEDQGKPLAVFPISKRLRYLVPFRDVSETLKLLAEQAQYQGPRLVTLFDDGEKFGGWPETAERVYRQGWLRQFFRQLTARPEVEFTLLSSFRDEHPALGRIYLDNASYEEMGEWVMTPDRFRQYESLREKVKNDPRNVTFLRTGYYRNFLVKYPEANRLHKRMIFVSDKIRRSRQSEEKRAPARAELYRGQGNDAYWHGIFGGLYLPHLRQGTYRHILRADNLLGENLGVRLADFDACGRKEIIFDYRDAFLVINPNAGGSLLEFDAKAREINWLDTITRQAESYHSRLRIAGRDARIRSPAGSIHERALVAAEGVERYLHYDPGPRSSLLDHFYRLETTVQDCYEGQAQQLHDVALAPRNYELEQHKVVLSLSDFLDERPCHLYKEVMMESDRLRITCDIVANFWQPFRYAVEFSLLPVQELQIGDRPVPIREIGEAKKVAELLLVHESGAQLRFSSRKLPFTVWYYPIETVSSSEKGAERIYQGTALVLSWELHKPSGVFEFEVLWS